MNLHTIQTINAFFLKLFGLPEQKVVRAPGAEGTDYPNLNGFLNQLTEVGSNNRLIYIGQELQRPAAEQLLAAEGVPVLCFVREGQELVPVVLVKKQHHVTMHFFRESGTEKQSAGTVAEALEAATDRNGQEGQSKLFLVTAYPQDSFFTTGDTEATAKGTPMAILQRFMRLLHSERREITYLYVYASIGGIISLSLPLGIQSIIGFITSGQVTTSVIVLIGLIVLGLLITGGMQIMQLWLVERIQQRLFTKTAFEFAFRLPRLRLEALLQYHPAELMNRFFDVVSLQKGLAKILIELTAALLQVVFGLVLLSLYHPYFIFFGLFLIMMLLLIIRLTGAKGIKTSLYESKYKYRLAHWLQEMARTLTTFKLAGHSPLPMQKTDYFTSHYLHARNQHFMVLLAQYFSFVGFKTVITGGLLSLGCWLVLQREINIGQFVASEIVIILIMNSVEKIVLKLETVYDVLTSLEKISAVTDLPLEKQGGLAPEGIGMDGGLPLQARDIRYRYPDTKKYVLQGIDLDVQPSERVCLAGFNSAGRSTFVNVLLGMLFSFEGSVSYGGLSLRDVDKRRLRSLIGDTTSYEQIFDGTLLENITLHHSRVQLKDVLWALDSVGLNHYVQELPEGLQTHLIGGSLHLPRSVAKKIIIARSLVHQPRLLILDDFLLDMERTERNRLLNLLLNRQFPWTVLLLSNDPNLMRQCDRTVVLRQGQKIFEGNYEQLQQQNFFAELAELP